MKTIIEVPKVVINFESDEEKNPFKVPIKVWKYFNGTEILIRIKFHSTSPDWETAWKILSRGDRMTSSVAWTLKSFLKDHGIIKNAENWEWYDHTMLHRQDYQRKRVRELREMDEYEDKRLCEYFLFVVEENLLKF